jgi:flagellar basal-body rod modification protein FlgD
MTINPIASTYQAPAPAPSSTTSATAGSNTSLDRQAFLKLLVAQLRYQDPSKPMDASQMVSQSAELSVVDKLDEISKTLSGSTLNDQLMLGGSLIGKSVTFTGSDGTAVTEMVTSARLVNGSMVLTAGDWDVPIAAVTGIAPAAGPVVAPTASDPSLAAPATANPPTTTPAATGATTPDAAANAAAVAAVAAATAAVDASTVDTSSIDTSSIDTDPQPSHPQLQELNQ